MAHGFESHTFCSFSQDNKVMVTESDLEKDKEYIYYSLRTVVIMEYSHYEAAGKRFKEDQPIFKVILSNNMSMKYKAPNLREVYDPFNMENEKQRFFIREVL